MMNRRDFIRKGLLVVPVAFGAEAVLRANSIPLQEQSPFFSAKIAPTGGGGGGITLLGSGLIAASSDGITAQTSSYNTTGASLIVVVVSMNASATAPTDSKGNTWTLRASGSVTFGSMRTYIYSCASPTTDSAQTFSISANAPSIAVYAFSGGTGVFDQQNSNFNNGAANTCSTGSITPSTSGQVIIAALAYESGSTASINSGFSTPLNVGRTANNSGCAAAFLVQSVAGAVNPTFTVTGNQACAAAIASFK